MTDDDYLWDPRATPDADVAELEAVLRPFAHRPAPLGALDAPRSYAPPRFRRPILAAASILLLAGGGWLAARLSAPAPWTVAATSGVPRLQTSGGAASGVLTEGGVLETDAGSSARLAVGRIGVAELSPGSRLRLLRAVRGEHRLALERGTMHASVDAPPRVFLVETASALAADLGCEYTLSVDESGAGLLTVEEGEVELERNGTRSSVLAGNSAALLRGRGPGLPYPSDAPIALRRAVAAFDAHPEREGAVEAILAASDARSTITLWHLLQRAAERDRPKVFDRLASIAPPPSSVERVRVLRGESGPLQRWRTDLQPAWITEPLLWRRIWLRLRP